MHAFFLIHLYILVTMTVSAGFQEREIPDDVRAGFPPIQNEQAFAIDGSWQLSWDDSIGTELTGEIKSCDIRFSEIDGRVSGKFMGPVAGTERNAAIDGELVKRGDQYVLIFLQRESDYVCSYQMCWNRYGGIAESVGVWCDSKGRNGNFSLLKYQ